MNLPTEIIQHILTYRPIHPVAAIIKQKYKEYDTYRLPSGNPSRELDSNTGRYIVYSAPLIKNCKSFLGRAEYNGEETNVSFNEWILYFIKNTQELWANEYQYW